MKNYDGIFVEKKIAKQTSNLDERIANLESHSCDWIIRWINPSKELQKTCDDNLCIKIFQTTFSTFFFILLAEITLFPTYIWKRFQEEIVMIFSCFNAVLSRKILILYENSLGCRQLACQPNFLCLQIDLPFRVGNFRSNVILSDVAWSFCIFEPLNFYKQ